MKKVTFGFLILVFLLNSCKKAVLEDEHRESPKHPPTEEGN